MFELDEFGNPITDPNTGRPVKKGDLKKLNNINRRNTQDLLGVTRPTEYNPNSNRLLESIDLENQYKQETDTEKKAEILQKIIDNKYAKSVLDLPFVTESEDPNLFKYGKRYTEKSGQMFGPNDNVYEWLAQNQSRTQRWGNAALEVANTFGTEVLKMIPELGGFLAGGALAAMGEKPKDASLWSYMIDNATQNFIVKALEEGSESLRSGGLYETYTPKSVTEGNFGDNFMSSSFWATEGANAVGFFASMFTPGVAIKAMGLGAKALSTSSKIIKASKPLFKAAKAEQGLSTLSKSLTYSQKMAGKLDDAIAVGANTLFEAGAESAETKHQVKEALLAQGYSEEIAESIAMQKASEVFNANSLILLVPNALMWSKTFGKGLIAGNKALPKGSASSIIKEASKNASKEGFAKALRDASTNYLAGWNKTGRVLKNMGESIFMEGLFEEGLQFAVAKQAEEMALGKTTDDWLSGTALNWWKGWSDVDFQKGVFLGGLLGMIGGGVGTAREQNRLSSALFGSAAYTPGKVGKLLGREQKEATQGVVDLIQNLEDFNKGLTDTMERKADGSIDFNKINLREAFNTAKGIVQAEGIEQLMELAEQEGNEKALQTLSTMSLNQLLHTFNIEEGAGKYLFESYINSVPENSAILYNAGKMLGIQPTTQNMKAIKSQLIEWGKSSLDLYDKVKDYHERSFVNPFKDDIEKANQFSRELLNKKLNLAALQNTAKMSAKNRIAEIRSIGTKNPNTNPDTLFNLFEQLYNNFEVSEEKGVILNKDTKKTEDILENLYIQIMGAEAWEQAKKEVEEKTDAAFEEARKQALQNFINELNKQKKEDGKKFDEFLEENFENIFNELFKKAAEEIGSPVSPDGLKAQDLFTNAMKDFFTEADAAKRYNELNDQAAIEAFAKEFNEEVNNLNEAVGGNNVENAEKQEKDWNDFIEKVIAEGYTINEPKDLVGVFVEYDEFKRGDNRKRLVKKITKVNLNPDGTIKSFDVEGKNYFTLNSIKSQNLTPVSKAQVELAEKRIKAAEDLQKTYEAISTLIAQEEANFPQKQKQLAELQAKVQEINEKIAKLTSFQDGKTKGLLKKEVKEALVDFGVTTRKQLSDKIKLFQKELEELKTLIEEVQNATEENTTGSQETAERLKQLRDAVAVLTNKAQRAKDVSELSDPLKQYIEEIEAKYFNKFEEQVNEAVASEVAAEVEINAEQQIEEHLEQEKEDLEKIKAEVIAKRKELNIDDVSPILEISKPTEIVFKRIELEIPVDMVALEEAMNEIKTKIDLLLKSKNLLTNEEYQELTEILDEALTTLQQYQLKQLDYGKEIETKPTKEIVASSEQTQQSQQKIDTTEIESTAEELEEKKADIERRKQEDLKNAVIFLTNDGTYGGSKDFSLSEYLSIQTKENGEKFNVNNWEYINVNGTGVFFIKEEGVAYIIPNNTYNKNPRVVKLFFNKGTQRINLSNPNINTPNLKLSAQSDKVNYDSLLQEVQSVIQPLDAELAALESSATEETKTPKIDTTVVEEEITTDDYVSNFNIKSLDKLIKAFEDLGLDFSKIEQELATSRDIVESLTNLLDKIQVVDEIVTLIQTKADSIKAIGAMLPITVDEKVSYDKLFNKVSNWLEDGNNPENIINALNELNDVDRTINPDIVQDTINKRTNLGEALISLSNSIRAISNYQTYNDFIEKIEELKKHIVLSNVELDEGQMMSNNNTTSEFASEEQPYFFTRESLFGTTGLNLQWTKATGEVRDEQGFPILNSNPHQQRFYAALDNTETKKDLEENYNVAAIVVDTESTVESIKQYLDDAIVLNTNNQKIAEQLLENYSRGPATGTTVFIMPISKDTLTPMLVDLEGNKQTSEGDGIGYVFSVMPDKATTPDGQINLNRQAKQRFIERIIKNNTFNLFQDSEELKKLKQNADEIIDEIKKEREKKEPNTEKLNQLKNKLWKEYGEEAIIRLFDYRRNLIIEANKENKPFVRPIEKISGGIKVNQVDKDGNVVKNKVTDVINAEDIDNIQIVTKEVSSMYPNVPLGSLVVILNNGDYIPVKQKFLKDVEGGQDIIKGIMFAIAKAANNKNLKDISIKDTNGFDKPLFDTKNRTGLINSVINWGKRSKTTDSVGDIYIDKGMLHFVNFEEGRAKKYIIPLAELAKDLQEGNNSQNVKDLQRFLENKKYNYNFTLMFNKGRTSVLKFDNEKNDVVIEDINKSTINHYFENVLYTTTIKEEDRTSRNLPKQANRYITFDFLGKKETKPTEKKEEESKKGEVDNMMREEISADDAFVFNLEEVESEFSPKNEEISSTDSFAFDLGESTSDVKPPKAGDIEAAIEADKKNESFDIEEEIARDLKRKPTVQVSPDDVIALFNEVKQQIDKKIENNEITSKELSDFLIKEGFRGGPHIIHLILRNKIIPNDINQYNALLKLKEEFCKS